MARSITVIPASQPYRVGGRTQQKTRNLRVAAYCRVSTDQEEQLNSFENQVEYYTKYIQDNPLYQMAGIYADEGISGTNTKKREEFKRMIRDCEEGKIDLVITKSISRFARNTQDCLEYSRRLKNLGIGIFFEKEHINTLDASGELLFTILSSLAQDESRNISENCKWGIRSKFKKGIPQVDCTKFLGRMEKCICKGYFKKRKIYGRCPFAKNLYSRFPYQESKKESRGSGTVLCKREPRSNHSKRTMGSGTT